MTTHYFHSFFFSPRFFSLRCCTKNIRDGKLTKWMKENNEEEKLMDNSWVGSAFGHVCGHHSFSQFSLLNSFRFQFYLTYTTLFHPQNFREQSIDGEGLMMLTEEHLINILGMKLGPALKLRSNLLKRLNEPCEGKCAGCLGIGSNDENLNDSKSFLNNFTKMSIPRSSSADSGKFWSRWRSLLIIQSHLIISWDFSECLVAPKVALFSISRETHIQSSSHTTHHMYLKIDKNNKKNSPNYYVSLLLSQSA
jgi:hypothetical protein